MTPEQIAEAMPQVERHVDMGLLAFPAQQVAGTKKPKYTGWQSKVWDLGMLEAELRSVPYYGLTQPKQNPRRLVILDLDDGREGLRPGQIPWQDRWRSISGVPQTKVTLSPSGGAHAWYTWPAAAPLPGGSWHGFTVRSLYGAKNWAVGPGSVRPDGRPYIDRYPERTIAEMPVDIALSGVKPAAPSSTTITVGGYQLPEAIDHGACHAEVCRYTLSLWNAHRTPSEMWTLVLHELGPRLAEPHTEDHLREHFDRATKDLDKRFDRRPPADLPTEVVPVPDRAMRFYSPLELATITRPEPDWIAGPGLLAVGAITEIDGKIKAAGKTTFTLFLVRAVLDGSNFLGHPTRRAKVIYITEQSRQTFNDALRRVGLEQRGTELLVLFREDIGGNPWPAVVAACRQDGYEVVVVDTIGKLAGIKEENAAGEWAAAMSPLQDLAASGRAVLIDRHDRKGGGDVGESGRGSSQASGDVDIILAIRRPEGNQPTNRRVIESLSRYPETPDKVVVELTDDGYTLLGSEEAVAADAARSFVGVAVGSEFHKTSAGVTRKRLEELGNENEPKVRSWAIRGAIAALLSAGDLRQTGAGKARDPFLLWPREAGPESCETQIPSTTQPQDLRSEALRIFGDLVVGSPA